MCMSHESWPRKALHKLRRSNRHTWNSFTWPPEGCKVLLLASVGHVCLFARISQKPRVQTSLIFEQVTYGHGSVFLWRQWVASCFDMGLIHKTRHGRVLQVTYREVARGRSLILRLPWYGSGVLQWVCLSVCLSAREHISIGNYTSDLQQIFVHVTSGRGFVLLYWCCDTLCTSGFMCEVIFTYIGRK